MRSALRLLLFFSVVVATAHFHPSARSRMVAAAEAVRANGAEIAQAFRALETSQGRSELPGVRPDEAAILKDTRSPELAAVIPGFEPVRRRLHP